MIASMKMRARMELKRAMDGKMRTTMPLMVNNAMATEMKMRMLNEMQNMKTDATITKP